MEDRQFSRKRRVLYVLAINTILLTLVLPIALFMGGSDYNIISEIRLPRVVTALIAGIALAIASVLSQAIFINPIIEPSFLGLNSAAALFAVLSVILGVANVGHPTVILFAFIGALIGALVIWRISQGRSSLILILNGIALTAITTALLGALLGLLDRNDIRAFSFWSLGSLALADWEAALYLTIATLVVIPLVISISSELDLLSIGELGAGHFGLDISRLRLKTFLAISILVAAAVSTIGSIAFLGLASAHIARAIVGPKQIYLLPTASLVSANIILLADTFARRAFFPQELPIGFIVALLAAPILLLALKGEKVWRER